ncbi:MAG: 4Fe-4S binding protein [Bacteroidales bacterium]|nr:4Fe-4S binding protein [Bacteroidales bacterium]MDZ4203266.1 4Fe-4S binding protein [Bacteroidales bacterium]
MKVSSLRKIRIVFSLIMFSVFLVLFLDLRNLLPSNFYSVVLFSQFIPSFLSFITAAGWAAIGFIVVMVLTLLFGRVYCSFLCPLGVLQDLISRVANWFRTNKKRKKRVAYYRSWAILHYSILVLIVIAFIAGFVSPMGWLDPYSIFGRFMAHIVRPIVIQANNFLVYILEALSVYHFKPLELKVISWFSVGVATGLILLVSILAAFRGREYCNTVCPVGAVLRLTSIISIYKLKLHENKCNSCGLCASACKAGCINSNTKSLDFERCIACYNCITACKSGGVGFENVLRKEKTSSYNPARRSFLAGSAVALLGGGSTLTLLAQDEQRGQNTTRPEEKEFAVSPPGSLSIDHFISKCTACHLCVSVCPKQVLQPSLLEYGLKGFLQPRMDFHTSYCNFDCVKCGEVCPTGAILPLTIEEKHLTQTGKAWFIRRNCIVRTDHTDCGACSEHCPTKAVQMVPWRHRLLIPKVNQDICIGCGACEYACPTSPYKAIYVDGNAVHKKADPPTINEEPASQASAADDFPF